ncbi:MAG: AAA family ATPase [Bacilli bacterium]|nr:AAA family ATPase [Bacilli bacterium]
MIVLSGASASGKTEVAKMLAKKYGIVKVITTTTRNLRVGEINGKDYFFVSKEEFLKMKENEEFVETTVYNGNFYGSLKREIADTKCIVADPQGLKAYSEIKNKNIVTFFLNAEEETRMKRMLERGDKPEDAAKRIANDREVFKLENFTKVDFHINSETQNVEEVCDEVYRLYNEKLNNK